MTAGPKPVPFVKEIKRLVSRPKPVDRKGAISTFSRDDYTCQWCKVLGGKLHPHHRLRRSQGGKDSMLYLVTVHPLCHSYIHDHPAEAKARGFLVSSVEELSKGWR
jgi:5-methylcytosine-specific restriction endonuclease McrA